MGINGKDGFNYSYDSSELIEELESDLQEFGDEKVWAYFRTIKGVRIYHDYQFLADEIKKGSYKEMRASELLYYLKEQDSIL